MKNKGLVYSTEQGRMCPDCKQPKDKCNCKQNQSGANSDGIVRVSRETKGRKGKGVTLITGIPSTEIELKFLAKELKTRGWIVKRVGG